MAITFKKETVLALIEAEIAKGDESTHISKSAEQQWVDDYMANWEQGASAQRAEMRARETASAKILREVFADAKKAAALSDHELLRAIIEGLRGRELPDRNINAYIEIGLSEDYWQQERERTRQSAINNAHYQFRNRKPVQTGVSLHEAREVVKLSTSEVFTMTDLKSLGVYQLVLDQAPKPAKAIELGTPGPDGVIDPIIED